MEQPRFEPFREAEEGRTAVFLLGDALGRAGAYEPARGYLLRLLERQTRSDTLYRRAVRSLVDSGWRATIPKSFVEDLKKVPAERTRRAPRRHRVPAQVAPRSEASTSPTRRSPRTPR